MNKQEFIAALRSELKDLPQNDIEKFSEYYAEMIDDRMEDGLTEYEAVEAMGNPGFAAEQILKEADISYAEEKSPHRFRAWEIVIIILGSPLWLSLLIAAIAVLLAFYILIWSAVLVVYACDLAFAAGAVSALVVCFSSLFKLEPVKALFYFGTALICFGAAVLLFFLSNKIIYLIIKLSVKTVSWIKSLFNRKGVQK